MNNHNNSNNDVIGLAEAKPLRELSWLEKKLAFEEKNCREFICSIDNIIVIKLLFFVHFTIIMFF